MKKLTRAENVAKFFANLQPGEVFTYSYSFCAAEVNRRGREAGLRLDYCPPESEEYKTHGSQTFKVLKEGKGDKPGSCWKPRIPVPMDGGNEACFTEKSYAQTCVDCSWWREEGRGRPPEAAGG